MDDWTMGLAAAVLSTVSALTGAGLKAYGTRLKSLQETEARKEARELSEQDLWAKIQAMEEHRRRKLEAMEQRLQQQDQRIEAVQAENSDLRVQLVEVRADNRHLSAQYEELSRRYDRLRESHDSILAGGPPLLRSHRGPDEGPSSVPGGDTK